MRVTALVAHLRTALRLPIRSIQRYLADLHGLRVSAGAIVGLLQRVAAHGATAVEQIRDRLAGGGGQRLRLVVGDPGRRTLRRAACQPRGRRGERLAGRGLHWGPRHRLLWRLQRHAGGQHQRCWVHLLRDLHALGEAYPTHLETQIWVAAVQAVFTQLRRARQAILPSPTSPATSPATQTSPTLLPRGHWPSNSTWISGRWANSLSRRWATPAGR